MTLCCEGNDFTLNIISLRPLISLSVKLVTIDLKTQADVLKRSKFVECLLLKIIRDAGLDKENCGVLFVRCMSTLRTSKCKHV